MGFERTPEGPSKVLNRCFEDEFTRFYDHARSHCQTVGRKDPDDMMFMLIHVTSVKNDSDVNTAVYVIAELPATSDGRNSAFRAIGGKHALAQLGVPILVFTAQEAWGVKLENGEEMKGECKDHPKRQESLVIHGARVDGITRGAIVPMSKDEDMKVSYGKPTFADGLISNLANSFFDGYHTASTRFGKRL